MGLLDYFFKKKDVIQPKADTDLFGYRNVDRVFDYFDYIADPVQYYSKIPDRSKLRQLYYDDEISSAIDTRMEAATSTPWTLEGGSKEVNDFIYENLQYCGKDILNYSWWSVAYGFSVFQAVYAIEKGRVWWGEIYDQPYDAFTINKKNELILKKTREVLDPFKFIKTVSKPSYYNPMGEPLLAKLYYPFYFKCNGWDFYMKFIERWGAPFLHAKTDNTSEELRKILKKLGESKRPTAISTDKETEITAIDAGGSGETFDMFTRSVNERIQRTVLGQTLTSGTGDSGSYALGMVHDQVRMDKKKSDCELISKTVQNCIDMLFYLNNFSGDIPQFIFADPKGLQKERAERDRILNQIGVQFNKKYFVENYDIDPEHFEVVERNSNFTFSEEMPFDYSDHKHNCKFASKSTPTVQRQIELENEMIKLSNNSFSRQELQTAIKSARSQKDLEEKLAILMEKDSGKFEEVTTKALFMAKEMGYVHGEEETVQA